MVKRLKQWFSNLLIKIGLKKRVYYKMYSYRLDKNQWFLFKGGKRKKMLRVVVRELAEKFTKFNEYSYRQNRMLLIESYEYGGIEGIKNLINHESHRIESLKRLHKD